MSNERIDTQQSGASTPTADQQLIQRYGYMAGNIPNRATVLQNNSIIRIIQAERAMATRGEGTGPTLQGGPLLTWLGDEAVRSNVNIRTLLMSGAPAGTPPSLAAIWGDLQTLQTNIDTPDNN